MKFWELEKMKFTAAHWGTYKVRQKVGKDFKLIPFEQDKDPSDIGRGIESAIAGDSRIQKPAIRKGWLEPKKKRKDTKRGERWILKIDTIFDVISLAWLYQLFIFTSNSDDAIVGLRLANILTSTVTCSIFVSEGGSTTRYLVKDLSIPPASSVELVNGGAKIVLQTGDILKGISSAASSVDVWCSVVDSIST